MAIIIEEKIKIGVSACNFGARVRWNRKGWDRVSLLEREKDPFLWTPVCPEVLSGLGVPRQPIRLVGGNGDDFWQQQAVIKNKLGEQLSEKVRDGAMAALDNLNRAGIEAFVFQEGSPSCGIYRTTLKNRRLGKPPGVFGSLLLKEQFFLIPSQDMESALKWWDWRRRLHAFVWLKRQELSAKQELYDIWHNFKFLCQEVDARQAESIGRQLAAMPRKLTPEFTSDLKNGLLLLLRRPSKVKRIEAAMQKHAAYYRKQFGKEESLTIMPKAEAGKRRFVKHLMLMEQKAVEEGLTFGGVPVVYRAKR